MILDKYLTLGTQIGVYFVPAKPSYLQVPGLAEVGAVPVRLCPTVNHLSLRSIL
jgi:hypothetical protein